MQVAARAVLLILLSILMTGCASPWEKNFESNAALDEKFPPSGQVEVRMVEFERLANYEKVEKQRRVESATSPFDYTPEQRIAAKNRLLEALQIAQRGDDIQILGWSRFSDTSPRDLRDAALRDFAEKIGADTVVVSIGYIGQINRVVDYPLTSYSNYYTTVAGRRGGRGRTYYSTESSTVWVPTTVTENQYYHQAVFLRRTPGGAATQPSQ